MLIRKGTPRLLLDQSGWPRAIGGQRALGQQGIARDVLMALVQELASGYPVGPPLIALGGVISQTRNNFPTTRCPAHAISDNDVAQRLNDARTTRFKTIFNRSKTAA